MPFRTWTETAVWAWRSSQNAACNCMVQPDLLICLRWGSRLPLGVELDVQDLWLDWDWCVTGSSNSGLSWGSLEVFPNKTTLERRLRVWNSWVESCHHPNLQGESEQAAAAGRSWRPPCEETNGGLQYLSCWKRSSKEFRSLCPSSPCQRHNFTTADLNLRQVGRMWACLSPNLGWLRSNMGFDLRKNLSCFMSPAQVIWIDMYIYIYTYTYMYVFTVYTMLLLLFFLSGMANGRALQKQRQTSAPSFEHAGASCQDVWSGWLPPFLLLSIS